MKFGILFTSQPDPATEPYPHRAVHDRVAKQVVLADQLGYDYAWIAEHHASTKYGIMPDPLTYIAYLATQTSRIKLGSGIMTLPLHNILRLAENVALVDILTGGRLVLGIGSGYRKYEFDALNVDFDQRRDIQVEGLKVLMEMFSAHRIDHSGKYFKFQISGDYEILPHTLQQPCPPLYMAAASKQSIGLGASFGAGLLLSTLTPVSELVEAAEFYRASLANTVTPYDKNPAFGDIDVARFVYVAESDEKAREESAEGIVRHVSSFTQGQTSGYLGTVSPAGKQLYSDVSYDKLIEDTILHGSPKTVVEKIESLTERTGATSLMLHFPPYYGADKTSEMLTTFAESIIPKFH
jgi:alkanesulfonate monooxygenase SsuD/methylene tetrahydromethanopterin reductase-like flavin-dependent oxidoreductase (luciferase family)